MKMYEKNRDLKGGCREKIGEFLLSDTESIEKKDKEVEDG